LIPLETKTESVFNFRNIKIADNVIFIEGRGSLYTFDRSGNFLNPIGRKGQGPGEYTGLYDFFFNTDTPTVFIKDWVKFLEYDFKGNFIRSVGIPKSEDYGRFSKCSHVGDNLFISHISYDGKNRYKCCLFNGNGDIVKCFPNYLFYEMIDRFSDKYQHALSPILVDKRMYLKDLINDTLYILENSNLKPAYVFESGKYKIPLKYLQVFDMQDPAPTNSFEIIKIVGTPKYFFYDICIPMGSFSEPKREKKFNSRLNDYVSVGAGDVLGIYDIEKKTNIMLDTDSHLQKGIVNDINGGLPIVPLYYAGDGMIVSVWNADEMKEKLTDEYFASQTIKDQAGHQKLKEILKKLKEDDNQVVVIATLKD